MRLVGLADIHNDIDIPVPDGDILAVSGDLTYRGRIEEVEVVAQWLGKLPHKHKVVIAGNHDFCFDTSSKVGQRFSVMATQMLTDAGCIYLKDSGCEIEGLKFYGSPWQPWFHNWAFNVYRGDLHHHWSKIPNDLDVLLVHGPPFGYGDRTTNGDRVGCEELLEALKTKQPKYVFYGHIHEDTGMWRMNDGKTLLYNCSVGPIYHWNAPEGGSPVVVDI